MLLRTRRRYTSEYKLHVVRYSLESTAPQAVIAAEFDVPVSVLGRWRREYVSTHKKDQKPVPNQGASKSLADLERENRQLRKQLERKELEIDILKKAEEYFARHTK
ncbi:transposase [Halomonas cupida]|uniref:transposase n=1 Tax=Halomonas cupida TaxID=44933 RepID=UPI0011BE537A|nr:transposase [Halomonas cupida]